jgi:hypothetical protein
MLLQPKTSFPFYVLVTVYLSLQSDSLLGSGTGVFEMPRYISRKAKPCQCAQIFRLAETLQEPGTLCGVLKENNTREVEASLSLKLVESQSFFIRLQPDVLACDYDASNGDRAVERLLVALEGLPSARPPVVLASGRAGHRHVFTRVGTAEDYDKAKQAAKEIGFDVRRTIRPPLVRHRQGLPVSLLEPPTVQEAILRLTATDEYLPYSRRVFAPQTEMTSLPKPWTPLPDHMMALLRTADSGTGAYVTADGVLDRSSAIQGFLCSAAGCGWTYEEIRDALFDPANALGQRVREMRPDAAQTWLEGSWSKAVDYITKHERQCDALLDHAQKTLSGTRTSATDLKVITALIELCRGLYRFSVDFSQRDWMDQAGISGSITLRKSKARLMPLWFTSSPGNRHRDANRYTVSTALAPPVSTLREINAVDMGHDIWRYKALLPNGYRVYRFLLDHGPSSSAEIHKALGIGKPTIRGRLTHLEDWGLCKSDAGIYTAIIVDLDDVAYLHDVAPKRATQRVQTRIERENFRASARANVSTNNIPVSWKRVLDKNSRLDASVSPYECARKPGSPLVKKSP